MILAAEIIRIIRTYVVLNDAIIIVVQKSESPFYLISLFMEINEYWVQNSLVFVMTVTVSCHAIMTHGLMLQKKMQKKSQKHVVSQIFISFFHIVTRKKIHLCRLILFFLFFLEQNAFLSYEKRLTRFTDY